jgi:transposase-like protein
MGKKLPVPPAASWPRTSTGGYDYKKIRPVLIEAIERHGTILGACRELGVERSTVRRWRKDERLDRAIARSKRSWVEHQAVKLRDHALDVALNGAKNEYFDPESGQPTVLRRHDGKILQAALQQYAGWGQPEQGQMMAKEYVMVGSDGQTFNLSGLLRAHFGADLEPPMNNENEDGTADSHGDDEH